MEAFGHAGAKERVMADGEEVVGDEPEMLVGGHPVAAVEAGEVDWAGESSQGALAAKVEIDVEITEG